MNGSNEVTAATSEAVGRVQTAMETIARGGMVLVVDDLDREDEADFLMAADHATADDINFMARHGRGLVCQTITSERAGELDLRQQETQNTALHGTAFTVSVDAATGVTSGISAADRARTIRLVAREATHPAELARPGHIFPIVARPGGLFARRGHTEAGCDLARLAGCSPSAVICEVMADDGTMARGARVLEIAREHDLPLVSVEDVVRYRSVTGDAIVTPVETVRMPTGYGEFTATIWTSDDPGCRELVTISSLEEYDDGPDTPAPLVRLHSECLTGEAFGSHRCDCGPQLDAALAAIGREPGVVVYLRQEGRGIGLVEKFRAYALQDAGLDTVDANTHLGHRPDERAYAAATAALKALGVRCARLMTNNPEKYDALVCSGIDTERIAVDVGRTASNEAYLATKALRMGHAIIAGGLAAGTATGGSR